MPPPSRHTVWPLHGLPVPASAGVLLTGCCPVMLRHMHQGTPLWEALPLGHQGRYALLLGILSCDALPCVHVCHTGHRTLTCWLHKAAARSSYHCTGTNTMSGQTAGPVVREVNTRKHLLQGVLESVWEGSGAQGCADGITPVLASGGYPPPTLVVSLLTSSSDPRTRHSIPGGGGG